jgi:hypothetical protein
MFCAANDATTVKKAITGKRVFMRILECCLARASRRTLCVLTINPAQPSRSSMNVLDPRSAPILHLRKNTATRAAEKLEFEGYGLWSLRENSVFARWLYPVTNRRVPHPSRVLRRVGYRRPPAQAWCGPRNSARVLHVRTSVARISCYSELATTTHAAFSQRKPH